jgi:hypothetical protein
MLFRNIAVTLALLSPDRYESERCMLFTWKIAAISGAFVILLLTATAYGLVNAADNPSISVTDQVVQAGSVTIDKIMMPQAGVVVIHADDQFQTYPVIGIASVKSGENDNVKVSIDLTQGTPILIAMLHLDGGNVSMGDPILDANGKQVAVTFNAIGVDVDDQFVKDTGAVSVRAILAQQDGWIVIHAGDKAGTVLGHAPIKAGLNSYIKVTLDDPSKVTETMTAMIHIDAGKIGTYEFPGADTPPKMGTDISNEPFWTVAHVRVQDQQLAGSFTIPSVLSSADGWIVIHSTAAGGPVIGHAPVKAGLNLNVKVKIDDPTTITDQVSAMLHIDAGKIGTYEFPGPDAPVKDSADQLINPLFSTTGQPVPDMSATMAAMADMSATAAATPK